MQSKSENGNRLEPDSHAIPPTSVYPEPWYHAMTRGNISNSSSFECPNGGSESNDGQSYSNGRLNGEDDDGTKESQNTASSRSGMRVKSISGSILWGNDSSLWASALFIEGIQRPVLF
ncbi:nuclear transcription factor y subunit a-1 [Quercus suber]|uniref:Nuclear transcription factor y subunit a-1 n=1 Tax=Quercus suber TaxID=58331 RepID=A0AAW0JZT9_QUESU